MASRSSRQSLKPWRKERSWCPAHAWHSFRRWEFRSRAMENSPTRPGKRANIAMENHIFSRVNQDTSHKSTISMAMFNSYVSHYQRLSHLMTSSLIDFPSWFVISNSFWPFWPISNGIFQYISIAKIPSNSLLKGSSHFVIISNWASPSTQQR